MTPRSSTINQVAIKWCTACDDPFCAPCWSVIHSRGKRSLHSHCTISPGGRVSTKAIAPDGTDAGPFTPGESLIAETAGGGAGGVGHGDGGDGGYGGGGYGGAAAPVEQGYGATDAGGYAAAAGPLVEMDAAGLSVRDSVRFGSVGFRRSVFSIKLVELLDPMARKDVIIIHDGAVPR